MMERFRAFWTKIIAAPLARVLLRLGVSPDAVTVVGTLGVVFGALWFFPEGHLAAGCLFITAFVFSDLIDGTMARMSGRTSPFGAFLDSTLDRIGDGAIFAGLALYFAGPGDSRLYLWLSLICLVMGGVTSYARARAESLGYTAKVGIAERADRLVTILVLTFFSSVLDQPVLLSVALWGLAVASTVTVVQRIWVVRAQAAA
jgi:CDP-diacylglycerol--glycerol-3-phosphate 3-phosphatidyltransferase/CDP-diacylglycerol--inositol 3-phosphatidyltransferase